LDNGDDKEVNVCKPFKLEKGCFGEKRKPIIFRSFDEVVWKLEFSVLEVV